MALNDSCLHVTGHGLAADSEEQEDGDEQQEDGNEKQGLMKDANDDVQPLVSLWLDSLITQIVVAFF